jgi:hypothetical protein
MIDVIVQEAGGTVLKANVELHLTVMSIFVDK